MQFGRKRGSTNRIADKSCYCHSCDKRFDPLGIMSHRAMHQRKGEDVKIEYTNHTQTHYFSQTFNGKKAE